MTTRSKTLIRILTALLIAFAVLTILVLNGTLQDINDTVYTQIEKWISPLLTNIMVGISNFGEWFIYLPIGLLFLIIPKSRLKIGVPVTFTVSSSAVLNIVLKHIFAVERPDIFKLISVTGYGFPSGHAMNGTVFIGLCTYLFIGYIYKRPLKIVVVSISTIFMLLMGLSRIYLGVHTLTDILGGYLAGLIVLIIAILILQNEQWFTDKVKPKLKRA